MQQVLIILGGILLPAIIIFIFIGKQIKKENTIPRRPQPSVDLSSSSVSSFSPSTPPPQTISSDPFPKSKKPENHFQDAPLITSTKGKVIAIVILLLLAFGIMGGIIRKAQHNMVVSDSRTESDFTTETFTVKQLWEYSETENGREMKKYFLIEPKNEGFDLRISMDTRDAEEVLDQLEKGDEITVKVLSDDLINAREESGIPSRLYRFFNGKDEILIYGLEKDGETLISKDINSWNDVDTEFLSNRGQRVGAIVVIIFVIGILRGIIIFIKEKIGTSKDDIL